MTKKYIFTAQPPPPALQPHIGLSTPHLDISASVSFPSHEALCNYCLGKIYLYEVLPACFKAV